jgi:hypothetical protein
LKKSTRRKLRKPRESYNEKTKRKKLLSDLVKKIKSQPCKDCGKEYPPYVMDLDHVSGKKIDNVSSMVRRAVPYDVLLNELLKCEVRCANCHRLITHSRRTERFTKKTKTINPKPAPTPETLDKSHPVMYTSPRRRAITPRRSRSDS